MYSQLWERERGREGERERETEKEGKREGDRPLPDNLLRVAGVDGSDVLSQY